MDRPGLNRTSLTLAHMHMALESHLEDAKKAGIEDLRGLDDAMMGIEDAQKGILAFVKVLDGDGAP